MARARHFPPDPPKDPNLDRILKNLKEAPNFQAQSVNVPVLGPDVNLTIHRDGAIQDEALSMTDLSGAEVVEVTISHEPDGFRIWINVDGVCRLRAYRSKAVSINGPVPDILGDTVDLVSLRDHWRVK